MPTQLHPHQIPMNPAEIIGYASVLLGNLYAVLNLRKDQKTQKNTVKQVEQRLGSISSRTDEVRGEVSNGHRTNLRDDIDHVKRVTAESAEALVDHGEAIDSIRLNMRDMRSDLRDERNTRAGQIKDERAARADLARKIEDDD